MLLKVRIRTENVPLLNITCNALMENNPPMQLNLMLHKVFVMWLIISERLKILLLTQPSLSSTLDCCKMSNLFIET